LFLSKSYFNFYILRLMFSYNYLVVVFVFQPEEKMKFDSIFDSLGPVGGMLSGDKVKPVLLNSKLPVDILGRVWELSDLDRDGMLDREEFSVAMYLVYRALEGEPVPMSLPPPLVPPSKRKKPWVVTPAEKAKYDELFSKTDGDMDGLVSGPEVRDIFLKTGLPSATLARIWELCDIGDIGKLTREQFALALYLINLKLTKGLEPPQSLSQEMIPPSDRLNIKQVSQSGPFLSLSSTFLDARLLNLEKSSVEEEIKEKEEAIRQRSDEVQDLQDEVAKENEEMQRLQTQRQKVQEALEELDQQKSSLEEQLAQIRRQTTQEAKLESSPALNVSSETIDDDEESPKVTPLKVTKSAETAASSLPPQVVPRSLPPQTSPPSLPEMDFFHSDPFTDHDPFKDDPFGKSDPFEGDPFKGTDPFAVDSFFAQTSETDPFAAQDGGTDPFSSSPASSELTVPPSLNNDPFAPGGTKGNASSDPDPFAAVFGNESFGEGFADFSALTKSNGPDQFGINNKNLFQDEAPHASADVPPALPPKTGTPTRPPPPPPGQYPLALPGLGERLSSVPGRNPACACNGFYFLSVSMEQYPTEEDMIEWAKRESEREEKERLARLTQQEQEDLELAIALSKSELS
uniref:Epidermal growth factor receptor pathway substrate 15 n=1 Tax=Oryzias sinensis TaxID=183150 RepID=A0A8C7YM06_9TELE